MRRLTFWTRHDPQPADERLEKAEGNVVAPQGIASGSRMEHLEVQEQTNDATSELVE